MDEQHIVFKKVDLELLIKWRQEELDLTIGRDKENNYVRKIRKLRNVIQSLVLHEEILLWSSIFI